VQLVLVALNSINTWMVFPYVIKKTLFEICSGLDRAVIGEHWISGEKDEEKIG
jgi:hypothetical protein